MLNIDDKLNRKLHMKLYHHLENDVDELLYNQFTIKRYFLLHSKVERELYKYLMWGTLNLTNRG